MEINERAHLQLQLLQSFGFAHKHALLQHHRLGPCSPHSPPPEHSPSTSPSPSPSPIELSPVQKTTTSPTQTLQLSPPLPAAIEDSVPSEAPPSDSDPYQTEVDQVRTPPDFLSRAGIFPPQDAIPWCSSMNVRQFA